MKVVKMTPDKDSLLENFINELSNELQIEFENNDYEMFEVGFWNGKKYKYKLFKSNSFKFNSYSFELIFLPYSIDSVELYKINVTKKGKGFGTNLMNQILDVSDRMGIKIKLIPVDYDMDENSPKNYLQKLKEWYMEMGFKKSKFPHIDPYYTYFPSVEEFKMVG